MTESPISIGHASIREQFVIERQAGKRHRDIAEKLQISEGALIAAHAGAQEKAWLLQATRLQADWPALMKSLEPLGEVMALTRNISCVHGKNWRLQEGKRYRACRAGAWW